MARRRRLGGGAGGGAGGAGAAKAEKPQQRNAANARERARMRVLSRAFCRLKTTLPWVPADTKLSKLDTLRLATSYIAHLRAVLADEPSAAPSLHPLNLTWPFSFQQQSAGCGAGSGSGSGAGAAGTVAGAEEEPRAGAPLGGWGSACDDDGCSSSESSASSSASSCAEGLLEDEALPPASCFHAPPPHFAPAHHFAHHDAFMRLT